MVWLWFTCHEKSSTFSSSSVCNLPLKRVVEEEVVVEKNIYNTAIERGTMDTFHTVNDRHIGDIYWRHSISGVMALAC